MFPFRQPYSYSYSLSVFFSFRSLFLLVLSNFALFVSLTHNQLNTHLAPLSSAQLYSPSSLRSNDSVCFNIVHVSSIRINVQLFGSLFNTQACSQHTTLIVSLVRLSLSISISISISFILIPLKREETEKMKKKKKTLKQRKDQALSSSICFAALKYFQSFIVHRLVFGVYCCRCCMLFTLDRNCVRLWTLFMPLLQCI